MRSLSMLLFTCSTLVFAACGDDGSSTTIDAPTVDSPPAIDAAIDAPPAPDCAAYCTSIQANCTGANAQYGGPAAMASCMATCGAMPPGALSDTTGNTLGCRLYHAGMAAQAPAVHCRHAGPGGDGACGANCLGFCQMVIGTCVGANAQYGGQMANCMTACGGFATTPAYSTATTSGNSLACRMYHGMVASSGGATATTHCPHTAVASAPCQ